MATPSGANNPRSPAGSEYASRGVATTTPLSEAERPRAYCPSMASPKTVGSLVIVPAAKRADAEGRVRAAAGELLRDPTSKKGQEVLKQALEDLNRLDRLNDQETTDKPNFAT